MLATAPLLTQPLATAEFLAVDTETNGLARERCELTEVGAVLVGGGELHDRWASLVGVSAPLSPGIQRFTGISQAMVDAAPPPEAVLPELARRLRGRVLIAHSARFDLGVLRAAFARAALDWPDPPVLCTVALARRFAPLQRRRGLAALADALGVEVAVTHRALPDAETCARVFCALFARLTAHAGDGRARRSRCSARGAPAPPGARARAPRRRPPARAARPLRAARAIPASTSSATPTAARSTSASRSACARGRARTSPPRRRGPAQAEHVDYQATESELGALLLEDRLIKALRPPGNVRGKRSADGYVYLRCRLDIAFPDARGRARAGAAGTASTSGRCAAARPPPSSSSSSTRSSACATAGAGCPRRDHPSAYGQMGRCLSPCLGDLDPNLYRERLDSALRLFVDGRDGGGALLAHLERQLRGRQRRAPVRAGRLAARAGARGWRRCCAASAASCAPRTPGRGWCWRRTRRRPAATTPSGSRAAGWSTGGRSRRIRGELAARTAAALRAAPRPELGGWLPAEEVAEARLVGAWVAAHEPPALELGPQIDERLLAAFAGR